MKRLGIVVCLILGSSGLFAQGKERVSGYLGKRVVVGIGSEFSLSRHPQVQSPDFDERVRTLNRSFCATMEFAVKNHLTIGVRGGVMSTSADFYEDKYSNGVTWKDDMGEHRLRSIQGSPGIKSSYIGFHLKRFVMLRGSLAPMGVYFGFGANFHRFEFDYSDLSYTVESSVAFGDEVVKDYRYDNPKGTASYPELFVEFGRAIPLGERFMMDFSFKSGALFNDYKSRPNTNHDVTLDEFTNYEVKGRLRDYYLFNCSVKFSVLL